MPAVLRSLATRPLPIPGLVVSQIRTPFYATDQEIDAWLDYEHAFDYVREKTVNDGYEVELFQKFCGGQKGDSWCADWQSFCLYGIWPHIPIEKSGSCQTLRERAAALGWLLKRGTYPRRGDIGLVIDVKANHAHHIFAVTAAAGNDPLALFPTLEGNTNPAGGDNGYGVFARASRGMKRTTTYEFFRLPRPAHLAQAA